VLASFVFNLSPGGRSKSFGTSSGVFDISSAIWSTVSPIPYCGVARTGPKALVYVHVDCHQDFLS
jgi:hypothetical protein